MMRIFECTQVNDHGHQLQHPKVQTTLRTDLTDPSLGVQAALYEFLCA